MNRSVQQLQYALQTLALPVTAQLRLHPCDGCRVEELALAFDRWQSKARGELKESLTGEQAEALNRLDRKLLMLSGSRFKPTWTDAALRQSLEWRQVREMAREALAKFGWPLDVPPVAHG
ncbi:MAG TPA: hypothetical protein PLD25_27450 [Chloroflexota bacterium]|nr:hypothetical protein [Chloroflexota bacterium]